jgi:Tfp pilus assembly protein PilP
MTKLRQTSSVRISIVAAALALSAAPVGGATTAQKPAEPATTAETAAAPAESPAETPQGFTYSPEGRRDPFVSLLRRGTSAQTTAAARASGLAGLSVGELSLRGVMASRGGFVAIVQGSDNKPYIVRSGQKLADGSVRAIDKDSMVLLQQVSDPLSLETEREVRKVLRQEEAK